MCTGLSGSQLQLRKLYKELCKYRQQDMVTRSFHDLFLTCHLEPGACRGKLKVTPGLSQSLAACLPGQQHPWGTSSPHFSTLPSRDDLHAPQVANPGRAPSPAQSLFSNKAFQEQVHIIQSPFAFRGQALGGCGGSVWSVTAWLSVPTLWLGLCHFRLSGLPARHLALA